MNANKGTQYVNDGKLVQHYAETYLIHYFHFVVTTEDKETILRERNFRDRLKNTVYTRVYFEACMDQINEWYNNEV